MKNLNYDQDTDFALLYGILLGDGCLSRSKKGRIISITCHKEDDVALFEIICPKLTKIRKKEVKYRTCKNKIEINFSDKALFYKFKNKGFPVGKKGTEINIPKSFNDSLWKNIIQGYFATDGCLVICKNNGTMYPRIEFQSISKKLLVDVNNYLNKQGMNGGIYVSHKYPKKTWFTLYRLQYNGKKQLELFKDKIGFVNPKHTEKYEKYAGGGIRAPDLHVSPR